jgi:hypothetical protein
VCTKAIPVTTGRVLTRRCKHVGGVGAEVDEVVGGSKNGVGLIVCMLRIKLLYIRSECKHRISMSSLYRILLKKFITSPEMTKQQNVPHLTTDS